MNIHKKMIKRALVAIIGVCTIAFGLAFIIDSGTGSDSVNVFYDGLTRTFGLTHGTWTTIFCVVMIIATFFLNKKRIGFSTIAYLCFAQFIIDPTMAWFNTPSSFVLKIITLLFGMLVTSVGCGLCITSDMGLCVFDAFTFSIPDRFKLDFVKTRWVIEIIFVILGILFGGKIGIGTVICTIGFGPAIKFAGNCLKKPVDKFVNN